MAGGSMKGNDPFFKSKQNTLEGFVRVVTVSSVLVAVVLSGMALFLT